MGLIILVILIGAQLGALQAVVYCGIINYTSHFRLFYAICWALICGLLFSWNGSYAGPSVTREYLEGFGYYDAIEMAQYSFAVCYFMDKPSWERGALLAFSAFVFFLRDEWWRLLEQYLRHGYF